MRRRRRWGRGEVHVRQHHTAPRRGRAAPHHTTSHRQTLHHTTRAVPGAERRAGLGSVAMHAINEAHSAAPLTTAPRPRPRPVVAPARAPAPCAEPVPEAEPPMLGLLLALVLRARATAGRGSSCCALTNAVGARRNMCYGPTDVSMHSCCTRHLDSISRARLTDVDMGAFKKKKKNVYNIMHAQEKNNFFCYLFSQMHKTVKHARGRPSRSTFDRVRAGRL